MARGETLGRTFAIPSMQSRFPVDPYMTGAAVQGQPQAINPALDLPAYNLGDLDLAEGLADQVVDQKGKIRAFALDMAKKGIDVTQPDYTQPGGGLPFKTFQKMATNIMLDATRVVQSRQENIRERNAEIEGKLIRQPNFDPSKQLSDDDPLTRYFPSGLLEEVKQANRVFLSKPIHTPEDLKRAEKLYQDTIDNINAREDLTPAQKFYNEQAVVKPLRTDNPYNNRGNAYNDLTIGQRMRIEGYDVLLREEANRNSGRWSNFTKSTDTDGKVIAINKAGAGEIYGQHRIEDAKTGGVRIANRIVKRRVRYPDGSVWMEFENTEDGHEIPPIRVDTLDPLTTAAERVNSNTKYGDVPGLREAAVFKGYIGPRQAYIKPESLFDSTLQTADVSSFQPIIDQKVAETKSRLGVPAEQISAGGAMGAPPVKVTIAKKPQEFPLEDGTKIVVKPHRWGSGWYIEGTDQEHLDDEKVVKYLMKAGYFDQFLDQEAQQTNSGTPQQTNQGPAQLKSQYTKDGKSYTLEFLRQHYSDEEIAQYVREGKLK